MKNAYTVSVSTVSSIYLKSKLEKYVNPKAQLLNEMRLAVWLKRIGFWLSHNLNYTNIHSLEHFSYVLAL